MNRTNKTSHLETSEASTGRLAANDGGSAVMEYVSQVACHLSRVDQDLQVALGAITSAKRLRLRDLFGAVSSPDDLDEEQVDCGMDALFRARERSASVHQRLHSLPFAHPARRHLSRPVNNVETEFHSLFLNMSQRPDPQALIRDIKKVRRRIPGRLVRKITV